MWVVFSVSHDAMIVAFMAVGIGFFFTTDGISSAANHCAPQKKIEEKVQETLFGITSRSWVYVHCHETKIKQPPRQ